MGDHAIALLWGTTHKLCRELGRTMGRAEQELLALGIDVRKEQEANAFPLSTEVLEAARAPFSTFMLIAGTQVDKRARATGKTFLKPPSLL